MIKKNRNNRRCTRGLQITISHNVAVSYDIYNMYLLSFVYTHYIIISIVYLIGTKTWYIIYSVFFESWEMCDGATLYDDGPKKARFLIRARVPRLQYIVRVSTYIGIARGTRIYWYIIICNRWPTHDIMIIEEK